MGLARTLSRGQTGLDAYLVTVEVHLAGGLPGFTVTGLPAAAVRESKDRVRAALSTSGFTVPASRITVHLGPRRYSENGRAVRPRDRARRAAGAARGRLARGRYRVLGRARAERRPAAHQRRFARRARSAAARAMRSCCPPQTRRRPRSSPTPRSTRPQHLLDVVRHLSGGERLPRVAPAPRAQPRSPRAPISPTCAAKRSRNGRSSSRPPAATTC